MAIADALNKKQPAPADPDDELLGVASPVAKESSALTAPADDDAADIGPAMRLCKPRERAFVFAVMAGESFANAARQAGYGEPGSTPATYARIGHRISHYARVVDALAEEARKSIRSLAPQAVATVREVMTTFDPKARLKAADMVLSRTDPSVVRQDINVRHEVVDHDAEAVRQLREFKATGATREFLEQWFGYTGLLKYERLLAAEDAAKPIDAEFTEVVEALPDQEESPHGR